VSHGNATRGGGGVEAGSNFPSSGCSSISTRNDVLGKLIDVLRPHGVELWDFSSRFEYKSAHGRFLYKSSGQHRSLKTAWLPNVFAK
jgi:hypothetical protein